MITQFFGGLAGLRAVATLCLVLLAFACGWVVGGNNAVESESNGEVAVMATAQEVEEIRWLIEAEKKAPPVEKDQLDVAAGHRDPNLREGSEIGGAATLTRVDQNLGAATAPEC